MQYPSFLRLILGLCAAQIAAGETRIHELGVPAKGLATVRLHPGALADGSSSLLLSAGQNNTGLFVADIDLNTGKCEQYSAGWNEATYATTSLRSLRNGVLYLGSGYAGHLHRYDANHPERGLEDLGPIDPEYATYPTGIDEAPDGSIWVGSYPGAALTQFDPATGEFTRHGRMVEDDKYFSPLCGADGTIAGRVRSVTLRIIAFDRVTGERREVGPRLENPKLNPQKFHFYKGIDGLLYLDSYAGAFRIHGMDAVPVEPTELPAEMPGIQSTDRHAYQMQPALPDGRTVSFADADTYEYREVLLHDPSKTQTDKTIHLDWQGSGTEIWTLHLGPDEKIYGSSMLPERFFRSDRDGRNIVDFGQCSIANGEGYSMANYAGKIAIASYPGTRLSLYDPKLPYNFGTGPGANPLDVGRLNAISTRPHVTYLGPEGKLWVGSAPDYGLYGGTLSWFDPKSAARRTYHNIMEDCTPFDLEWIPAINRLLIGFITESGTGAPVRAERGGFALWDPVAEQADYVGDFGYDDLAGVCSLLPAGDSGLVYAISGRNPRLLVHYDAKPAPTQLLLVDPVARRVVDSAPIPESFGPLPFETGNILRQDSDGQIYGVTSRTVFRIEPGTCNITKLHHITGGDATVIGPIHAGRLFFASLWRLRALDL